jgi:hypothetical protein
MPANYVLLEKIVVGAAGASSVTFSGIPQTGYTDLKVVLSGRNDQSGIAAVNIAFNGSTANLSYRSIFGDGSSAASYSGTNPQIQYLPGTSQTANTFNNAEIYIPNYAGSTNKSFSVDQVQETNATTAYIVPFSGLWSQTAAITSITFSLATGNFVANSTFYLYGVAKLGTTPAISPYATGGNTIMTDGTYWYHAFLSSGTFTPVKGLSCDVLVVAGGGGGGSNSSGGGGAGGIFYATNQTVATAQTVTVGAGGGLAANGSNSTFASLTAAVGGGRGGQSSTGFAGGSGGGGAGYVGTGTIAGGASTQTGTGGTGYGNAGGNGADTDGRGGGGGGAGAVGGNSSGSNAGTGGAGNNTWSSWLNATGTGVSGFIAGGGGGGAVTNYGAGGSGGGGRGGNRSQIPTNGTANTGGGGGGVSDVGNSGGQGLGGSGLIVVRYAI